MKRVVPLQSLFVYRFILLQIILVIILDRDTMDRSPNIAFGNLDFPLSKMALSSFFTLTVFFIKNLVKIIKKPGEFQIIQGFMVEDVCVAP